MKHPTTGRRATSALPPLQPSLDRVIPARPTVQPDLHVERVLFESYMTMKAQRDSWRDQALHYKKLMKQWKAKGLAKKISYSLKPKESR